MKLPKFKFLNNHVFPNQFKVDWVQSHASESISLLLGTNSYSPCESLLRYSWIAGWFIIYLNKPEPTTCATQSREILQDYPWGHFLIELSLAPSQIIQIGLIKTHSNCLLNCCWAWTSSMHQISVFQSLWKSWALVPALVLWAALPTQCIIIREVQRRASEND